jgi:hypothetical protein
VAITDSGFTVAWSLSQGPSAFLPIPPNGVILGTFSNTLYAQTFDFDGVPKREAVVLTSPTVVGVARRDVLSDSVRIAVNDSNAVSTVAYSTDYLVPARFHVASVSSDGRRQSLLPVTLETGLDRQPGLQRPLQQDFSLIYAANGDLVLAYAEIEKLRNPDSQSVFLRRYSALGVPRGPSVKVAERLLQTSGNSDFTINLAPLPSGGVAIVWQDQNGFRVFGRYYAADNSALGEPFLIASGTVDSNAVTDPAGNLLAIYGTSLPYGPQPVQLLVQRFQGP